MEHSIFGTLPPELRNHVYHYTLQHECVEISWRTPDKRSLVWSSSNTRHSHPLAILETCRTTRAEATQLFYNINRFKLLNAEDDDADEMLVDFLTQIGHSNVKAIEHPIIIHVGHHSITELENSKNRLSKAIADLLALEMRYDNIPKLSIEATGTGAWWDWPLLGTQREPTLDCSNWRNVRDTEETVARAAEEAKAPLLEQQHDRESLSRAIEISDFMMRVQCCYLHMSDQLIEYQTAVIAEQDAVIKLMEDLLLQEERVAMVVVLLPLGLFLSWWLYLLGGQ